MGAFKTYLKQISDTMAREESYHPYLKTLLEEQGGGRVSVIIEDISVELSHTNNYARETYTTGKDRQTLLDTDG